MKIYYKSIVYGFIFGFVFLLVSGTVTALIKNKYFHRMISATTLDYVFLILTSLLLGIFIGLFYYHKTKSKACVVGAAGGGIGGFIGFGCSICNKIFVLILGVTGVLTYIEPYKPIVGSVGIFFLSYAIYGKIKEIKK